MKEYEIDELIYAGLQGDSGESSDEASEDDSVIEGEGNFGMLFLRIIIGRPAKFQGALVPAGSFSMLISITLRPRSMGLVSRSPLGTHTRSFCSFTYFVTFFIICS